MVYSFSSAPPKNLFVTIEDRNTGISLGNHDEVACITYSRYDLGGTVDPLSVTEPTPRITELKKGKESKPEVHTKVWCLKCKSHGHDKDHCLVYVNNIIGGG